jgi:beta-galactosidase
MWAEYKIDHLKFPTRVMVGTESNPDLALENWRLVEQNPYVIGDFVWTGMDHIGESGLGDTRYMPDGQSLPDRITIAKPWPAWINWCGDIDIIGNKKPQSFYRDVVWRQSRIEILVHAPIPSGMREVTSYWGWPDEMPSWNWKGCEGEILLVKVLSRCPRVRLELNGRLLSERAIDEDKGIAALFDVPYQPGTLRATALVGDHVAATCAIETSGTPSSIGLSPEPGEAMRGNNQLIYVPIEIRDDRSRRVPDADCAITVELAGPAKLEVLGTACPDDHPFLGSSTVKPFRGHALAVIRRTGEPGLIRLTCSSPNLSSAEVVL